jgi:hypothetical protein
MGVYQLNSSIGFNSNCGNFLAIPRISDTEISAQAHNKASLR